MADKVDQKLLKQTKFPPEFNQKVDMQKVNVEVMKRWIAGKISEILGNEDDVVIELCFNLLEGSRYPSIKVLQIQLTGFLDKDTAAFCKELWTLCLSAQANPQGVPKELLEAKKLELIQEKIAAEKAAEEARRRADQERTRERDIDSIRQRERGERGRGRYRGSRGGRDYDRRPSRDSRSPPRHRDSYRNAHIRRGVDQYSRSDRRLDAARPRQHSPGSRDLRSLSRSVTPPRRRARRSITRSPSRSRSPPRRRRSRQRSTSSSREDSRSPRTNGRRRRRRRSTDRESRSRDSDEGATTRIAPIIDRDGHRPVHESRRDRRSRSPRRPDHRRRTSDSPKVRSRSPRHKRHRHRRRSPSSSRSSSRARSLTMRGRSTREISRSRLRSPSQSRSRPRPRPRSHSRDQNGEEEEYRTNVPRHNGKSGKNHERSESRSRSPRHKKRRQSIERYTPGGKRSADVASPEES